MEEFEGVAQPKRNKLKKRLKIAGITIAVLVILGVVASIAVSAIADPNKYKPEIQKAFADATGYDLQINGDIGISLFPLPKAYVEKVVVANGSKQLAEVEQINVYPELIPLISGQKKISSIVVKNPHITLEKTETGASWVKGDKAQEKAAAEAKTTSEKMNLTIDSIEIKDGKLEYIDRVAGKNQTLDKLNVNASLASIDGPLNLDGSVEYNGLPIDLKGSVSNFADPKILADIDAKGTKLKFDGTKAGGKITMSSQDLDPLLTAAGSPNEMLAKRSVSFDGDAKYEDDTLRISNAKFSMGSSTGTAEIAAQFGDETVASANIALATLDLDELMGTHKEDAAKADEDEEKPVKKTASTMKAELVATAEKVIFKNTNYKNLNATVSVDGDNIALRPFSLDTPGNGSIETFGILSKSARGWNYDGNITAAADNIREMVAGAGVKLDNMNPKSLQHFSLSGNLNAGIEKTIAVNLSDLKLALDESNITGAFSVRTEKPTAVSFKGTIDKVDINNYQAKPAAKDEGTSGGIAGNTKLDFTWLRTLPVSADINATIGSITQGAKTFRNVRINGTAKPNEIKMKELSGVMDNLSVGALVELNVLGDRPKFNIDANVDKVKLEELTKTEDKTDTAQAKTGGQWSEKVFNFSPLDQIDGSIHAHVNSIEGNKTQFSDVNLTGAMRSGTITVEKFSSNVYGGQIQASGELKIAAVPTVNITFSADNVDISAASTGLVTAWPISGRTSVNGSFSSAGVHQRSMIENLNGNAAINATNVNIRGLDIASFAYNIANISDPLAVVTLLKSVSGGNKSTEMNSVGKIYAEKGVLKTQGLQVAADSAQGAVSGYVDLPKWNMDADAKFNLAVNGADKKSPSFNVHIFGPPDNLQKEYDTKELEKYSAEKGLLNQKKIDLLKPGGIENKLNDKLMKQLGVKGASGAPDAAAPTGADAAPAAAQPATDAAPMSDKDKKKAARSNC